MGVCTTGLEKYGIQIAMGGGNMIRGNVRFEKEVGYR